MTMKLADGGDLTLKGVVHDLNNVFQTIIDAAEALACEPATQQLAGTIQRSVEHGQRLVQGLVESPAATFAFEIVVNSAIQLARDFLQATHGPAIEFRTRIEPGLRLRGNPVEWERVIVNLLLNSAQAMRNGGEVRIEGSSSHPETRILVQDNGPGVPPEILALIFEPHFSTKSANSGLGLHIVRSIVESNGGTVTVANRGEGGAEFRIMIPSH